MLGYICINKNRILNFETGEYFFQPLMQSRSISQAKVTIPNVITLSRILITPLFIIFLIQGNYRRALILFLLAGVSDLADGLIARTWQQKSRLGSYLDPLADKLLMATSFVTLSIYHQIPSWLTVIVLSRDVTMALGVLLFRLADYHVTIRPTLLGKWTTTWQIATVLIVIIGKIWPVPRLVIWVFFVITAALTALSGVHYVYRGLKSVNHDANGRKGADGGG
jgi:cardiolipin synthase (CMP-forming)